MDKIKLISIPTLCHQSWQQMEQKEQGRYCTSCTKIVIDFTKMTNAEILNYLAGAKNVCGRFNAYQLSGINHQLGSKKQHGASTWKRWLVAAGLLGAGFFNKAEAQAATAVIPMQQQPVSKLHLLGKIAPRRKARKHPDKKTQPVTAETGPARDDQTDLVGYRADISTKSKEFDQLPEPVVCSTGLNVQTEMDSVLGAVVSGVEIYTPYKPSRVEMFYQYMRWPINNLSNLFK